MVRRNFQDDFLAKSSQLEPSQIPDVFFVNFAFAHSLTVDLQKSDDFMRRRHDTGPYETFEAELVREY